MSTFASIILVLFVINHGIAFGAGLYEMRMVTPAWTDSIVNGLDEKFLDTGRKLWGMVTTLPLTLLTIASLFLSWKTPGLKGERWSYAAVVTLTERVLTFAYFIPAMVKLQGGTVPSSQVQGQAVRWANLNYVRLALSLAG